MQNVGFEEIERQLKILSTLSEIYSFLSEFCQKFAAFVGKL